MRVYFFVYPTFLQFYVKRFFYSQIKEGKDMKKEEFKSSLILDILPILAIIIMGEISILQWKTGVVPPILAGILVAEIIAYMREYNLKFIEDAMGSGVKRVFPALLTVILVGLIVSSWIIGGIIPSMVYWGFKIIDFNNFIPIVMSVTSIVAIITGTSFTSIGTIGVSFIIIARQVGIPLEITAGAIVSGAFLGDKMSPLSDTTNISAALGKTDLFEHIQYMLMDTIPAFIISMLGFKIIGSSISLENVDMSGINSFLLELENTFNVTPFLFIVPLIVIILGIKRFPSTLVLFSSVIMGILSSFVFQNFKAIDIMKSTIMGVNQKFSNPAITKLFARGGINEVSSTVITIIFIGCLIGIINECGAFENLLLKIQKGIKNFRQLTVSVFMVSLGVGFVTGAQLLAIILPISIFLPLFEKFGLKNKNITRIVEATGTVGITLVPWSVPGIFIASTLGVEMGKVVPYLFFPISVMAINLFLNVTGIGVSRLENKKELKKYAGVFSIFNR